MVKTYLSILLIFRTECLATETLDEFPCWPSRAEGQAHQALSSSYEQTADWGEKNSEIKYEIISGSYHIVATSTPACTNSYWFPLHVVDNLQTNLTCISLSVIANS